MTEIVALPHELRSKLSASTTIATLKRCVEELVYNSLDAGAVSIAIRVDARDLNVQVIDNGRGLERDDFDRIAAPHSTDKPCDAKLIATRYGYKGRSLHAISTNAESVRVASRGSTRDTYELDVGTRQLKAVRERPCRGVTVTVTKAFHHVPVRERVERHDAITDAVKAFVRETSIVNYAVAISVRDDSRANRPYAYRSERYATLEDRVLAEATDLQRSDLLPLALYRGGRSGTNRLKVSGTISQKRTRRDDLQLVYVNGRAVASRSLHASVRAKLKRASAIGESVTDPRFSYAYVVCLWCPHGDVDFIYERRRTRVAFSDYDRVANALDAAIDGALIASDDGNRLNSDENRLAIEENRPKVDENRSPPRENCSKPIENQLIAVESREKSKKDRLKSCENRLKPMKNSSRALQAIARDSIVASSIPGACRSEWIRKRAKPNDDETDHRRLDDDAVTSRKRSGKKRKRGVDKRLKRKSKMIAAPVIDRRRVRSFFDEYERGTAMERAETEESTPCGKRMLLDMFLKSNRDRETRENRRRRRDDRIKRVETSVVTMTTTRSVRYYRGDVASESGTDDGRVEEVGEEEVEREREQLLQVEIEKGGGCKSKRSWKKLAKGLDRGGEKFKGNSISKSRRRDAFNVDKAVQTDAEAVVARTGAEKQLEEPEEHVDGTNNNYGKQRRNDKEPRREAINAIFLQVDDEAKETSAVPRFGFDLVGIDESVRSPSKPLSPASDATFVSHRYNRAVERSSRDKENKRKKPHGKVSDKYVAVVKQVANERASIPVAPEAIVQGGQSLEVQVQQSLQLNPQVLETDRNSSQTHQKLPQFDPRLAEIDPKSFFVDPKSFQIEQTFFRTDPKSFENRPKSLHFELKSFRIDPKLNRFNSKSDQSRKSVQIDRIWNEFDPTAIQVQKSFRINPNPLQMDSISNEFDPKSTQIHSGSLQRDSMSNEFDPTAIQVQKSFRINPNPLQVDSICNEFDPTAIQLQKSIQFAPKPFEIDLNTPQIALNEFQTDQQSVQNQNRNASLFQLLDFDKSQPEVDLPFFSKNRNKRPRLSGGAIDFDVFERVTTSPPPPPQKSPPSSDDVVAFAKRNFASSIADACDLDVSFTSSVFVAPPSDNEDVRIENIREQPGTIFRSDHEQNPQQQMLPQVLSPNKQVAKQQERNEAIGKLADATVTSVSIDRQAEVNDEALDVIPTTPSPPTTRETRQKPEDGATTTSQTTGVDFVQLRTDDRDVFVDKVTGMSYYQRPTTSATISTNGNPKIDATNRFRLKKRSDFLPKGMSPLLDLKRPLSMVPRDQTMSPSSKRRLIESMIETQDDLIAIKWANCKRDRDFQRVFDAVYDARSKKYERCVQEAIGLVDATATIDRDALKRLRGIGQWDRKFVMAVDAASSVLYVVDQHAADERVRLDRMMKRYRDASKALLTKNVAGIKLLSNDNADDASTLRGNATVLKRHGIEIVYEAVNDALNEAIRIVGVPLYLYERCDDGVPSDTKAISLSDAMRLLIEDELRALRCGTVPDVPPLVRRMMNMESCRGAIKFGDKLTASDCDRLLTDLAACNMPFACAHGRPTVVPLIALPLSDWKRSGGNGKRPNLKKLKLENDR